MNSTNAMPQFPPRYLAEDRSRPLLDVSITFLVLETFFISLLFLSRYIKKDDKKTGVGMLAFMGAGYIVCLGKITLAILMVKIGGAGHHIAALPLSTILTMLKLQTALQIVCPVTTSLSKLAVLCFFHRIFSKTSRTYRLTIHCTFIFVVAILLMQVLIPFANCKPFRYTWDPTVPGGRCAIDGIVLWRYISLPNVATDVVLIGLPLPALWKLRVSAATKVGLFACFGVAGFGMTAAILRLISFLAVKDFSDITYHIISPLCWTITESGTYLIAGVMPALRPLFSYFFRNVDVEGLWSRTFGRSTGKGASTGGTAVIGKPMVGGSSGKSVAGKSSVTQKEVDLEDERSFYASSV